MLCFILSFNSQDNWNNIEKYEYLYHMHLQEPCAYVMATAEHDLYFNQIKDNSYRD